MNTELLDIRNEILNELYAEAEPPLDFDEVLDNPDDYGDDWYTKHTLPRQRQREIREKYYEKYDLTEREEVSLTWETCTNLGPAFGDSNE
jgi:hypothetical protein